MRRHGDQHRGAVRNILVGDGLSAVDANHVVVRLGLGRCGPPP
jgi:hypothetical protein